MLLQIPNSPQCHRRLPTRTLKLFWVPQNIRSFFFSRKKATYVIFYLLQRHTTGKGGRIVWTQRIQRHQSKRAFSASPFVANCPPLPLMQTSPIPNISFSIQTYAITGLLESHAPNQKRGERKYYNHNISAPHGSLAGL